MSDELRSIIRAGILSGWNRHIVQRETAPDAMAEEVLGRVKDFVIVSEQRGYDRGQADAGLVRTSGVYDLCEECRAELAPASVMVGNWTLTVTSGNLGPGVLRPPTITIHYPGCARGGVFR